MPCKGTVLPCLPESWMCVNKCTEICSRLLEYTITNINVVRCNPLCENICVGTDSRHLWKPLEHFFSLCCLDFPQNYILNYMWPKKKRQKLEYFCWWPYSGLGRSLLEHHFQALLKSLLLCQKITLCFFQDCAHWPCPVLLQKCSSWEFHFASSPGFVNTVICCHVNNIQVYLLYVNGCRNGWLFSHPDFFCFFKSQLFQWRWLFDVVYLFSITACFWNSCLCCLSCQSNLLNKIHFSTYVLLSWCVCFFWILWFIVNREVPFYAWKTWFYCLWKFTVNFFEVQI